MNILGIDPGYGRLGWSIIDKNFKLLDFGVIETEPNSPIAQRLEIIYNSLSAIIDLYKPEFAGIEKLFFSKNSTTALDVAKAMGVVILLFQQKNIEYKEFTPNQIKKSIVGNGSANKQQMQFMIMQIFKLKEIPKPDDAADACGVAATCSMSLK